MNKPANIMAPSVLEILKISEKRLSGVDSPRLSAEVIVAEVLDCSRLSLVIDRHRTVREDEEVRIDELITRREQGEPIAYILGNKEFYGLDFSVTPDTLIPRPETEHIIEAIESEYSKGTPFHFADLGTGSGILAVTLAYCFPRARGVAVDLSHEALTVAELNAESHGVKDRLEFMQGDFTLPLLEDNSFELIVSNPPYVTRQEYAEASHEVTSFEPVTALVSGENGLDHITAMLPHVANALRPGGRFYMEIGYRQAGDIVRMITDKLPLFENVEVIKDLAGHDRIVTMRHV